MTKRQKIIFAVIITLAFLYRLIGLDYPLINTEPQRDYLIAQHILTFKDFPEKGPCCLFNGSYAPYRHPAIYYYILAGILTISQNFTFLIFVNFFLQIIPFVTIFVLTSRFFSYNTGLLAIFFYGFHQAIYKNALFFWQPHLKLPFLYGSFLALFLFYKTRKLWLLTISILLFFMSAAIHLSTMAIAPVWFIAFLLSLRSQKRSVKFYLATFLLIFLSLLVSLRGINLEIFKNPLLLTHTSIFDYGQSLFTNFNLYLSSLYANGKEISIVGILLIILNCVFLIGCLLQKDRVRKLYIIILIAIILGFIVSVSLFKATIWHFYLSPLFGIAIIVFAQTIAVQKHRFLKALSILWVILYVGQFFIYYPPEIKFFSNAKNVDLTTTALAQRIKDVQGQKGYPKPGFFLIQVYTQGVETPTIADLAFWLPLEEKLHRKFIQVNDATSSFKRLNSDDYIYIACQSFTEKIHISKDCLEPFSKEFSKHKINKIIYNKQPFTIYEALLK